MKKFLTLLLAVLFVLALSSSSFGQGANRDFTYYDDGSGTNPPIRSLCGGQGTPLPDNSVSICLYWDNNGNGPDPTDAQPPQCGDSLFYGCANFVCFQMNGEELGAGPGFFSTSVTGQTLSIGILPESPDLARYYWRINSALNGDSVCWTSSVYTLTPGYEDVYMAASDWTCTTGPCQIVGNPPTAPTNCQASDDSLCTYVFVTWEHSGQNVAGFSVYNELGLRGTTGGTARNLTVPVYIIEPHSYYVRATNAFGMSDSSNHDVGSGYLLRFASGPSGNLSGSNLGGQSFTIHFERPELQCPSLDSLFIIDSSNAIVSFLCVDSITTQMTCTLPDVNLYDLRLLLRAYNFNRPVMETDTTDSTFHLGPLAAGDRTLLIPDHFALEQNYPNPFNPTTTIDFAVPYESDVTIEVYNIAGQLVKTLVSGSITAGVHHITWDGLSDSGIGISSGLYFYRMSGPGFVQTKKMLMMK